MRLIWLGLLTAHGTAAVAWWWLMPGGFPAGHPRFWVNEALPVLVLAMVLALRFGIWGRERVRNSILAMFPAFWLAVAIAGRVIFPESGRWFFLAPLVLGLGTALMVWLARPRPARWAWGAMAVAAALGVLMPLAERGMESDTRPLSIVAPALPDPLVAPVEMRLLVLGPDVKLDPGDPVITLNRGRMTLAVQPLLTFVSRSPDRCWTLFASRAERDGPRRRLVHLERTADSARLVHRDDTTSWLDVAMRDGAVEIDAMTHLASPVYSHLNTFTELTISGHRKLSVSFSPCPAARVEFKPFSIRGDAPSRAAYLDADGTFRVVQARQAEKGPFTTLAEGKMSRADPLTMTLYDQDRAVFEVTLRDWAAQAGVQLSPTAGYGLPVNAIEFSIDGESDRSSAGMWITLAATSVGRGWDSVGHAAGTYRNRVRVGIVAPLQP
jgi:hypothetical protein